MRIRARFSLLAAVAAFILAFAGCDGNVGPDGEDAPFPDHTAPLLELTSPEPYATLSESTVLLRAESRGNADDLFAVRFMINSLGRVAGDSALVTTPPWEFEWNLDSSSFQGPLLTITATSIDTAGNTFTTPARLVRLGQVAGVDTLDDLEDGGSTFHLPVPLVYELIEDDGSGGTDTTVYNVDRVGERFYPAAACNLLAAEVMLTERPFPAYTEQHPFWVTVHAVTDSVAPGAALDSVLVTPPNPFATDRWLAADLSGLDLSFVEGDGFFVVVRPDTDDPVAQAEGVNLRTLYQNVEADSARLERAWWWTNPFESVDRDPFWEPLAATSSVVEHLYLRVVVDYGAAEGADYLAPVGVAPGRFDGTRGRGSR